MAMGASWTGPPGAVRFCAIPDMSRLVILFGALACSGWIGAASAAAVEPAAPGVVASKNREEDLVRRGVELRKLGDDNSALALFKQAFDVAHSARAAGQLGLCEQALGRWEDAEVHVTQALSAEHDGWADKNRVTLRESLATIRGHVARVELRGEPAGAEVKVNGVFAGRLPLPGPLSVAAGDVVIELHAPGYQNAVRNMTLVGAQYQRTYVRLEKEVVAAAVSPAGDPVGKNDASDTRQIFGGVGALAGARSSDAPAADREAGTHATPATASAIRSGVKWTALGVAGASLIAGVAATVIHANKISAFEKAHMSGCFDRDGRAVDAAGVPVSECQPLLDAAGTARTWQVIGFASAGVFAAAWLVLHMTEPGDSGLRATAWSCVPALDHVGGRCAITF